MNYMIGVDLGGTTMTAGLVNQDYEIVQKLTWPTNLPRPAQELESSMAELCRTLCTQAKVDFSQVLWVGVGTPGSVNSATGHVGFNVNFGYHNWNLGPNLEALLGCPVYIENDANAAAYGEYMAGAAKGANNAVVVTLGTGVGSGIIINGKIYAGSNYAGAEMGHMVIVKGGRPCNCGRNGCWERYASSRALAEDAVEVMERDPDQIMWKLVQGDLNKVGAKTVFDAMDQGDEVAYTIFRRWVEYVACGICTVVNIFQPEIVVIGGGVSAQGEKLLGPIRELVDHEEYNRDGENRTQIRAATLGNDAGVLGAASLGTQH